MTTEQPIHQEEEPEVTVGVALLFEYDLKFYGLPLFKEDEKKTEAVFYRGNMRRGVETSLQNKSIGHLGGAVQSNESNLSAALEREAREELEVFVDKIPPEALNEIYKRIASLTFSEIPDHLIDQFKTDEYGKKVIRGRYKIFAARLSLSQELFKVLEPHIIPISAENRDKLRPSTALIMGKLEEEYTDLSWTGFDDLEGP